jgi:hypothetical protein
MIATALHPAASPEFLSRLHDGELAPAEAAAFESHRSQCAECRSSVAEFERALSAYREASVAPAASDLSARILRKIRATSPSRRPFGVMFGIDVRWAGVLTAAILVVIIGAPVFSRRVTVQAPPRPASGPIPAYVLDAREARAAGSVGAPEPRRDELRAAPKPEAPAAKTQPREPARKEEPFLAAAPPGGARDNAAAEKERLEVAAPPAPLAESKLTSADAREAPASQSARPQTASAPAGDEAGAAGVAEELPSVHLTIQAIDGQGTAPDLVTAPSDERLAAFRGREFVLLVESGGRVRAVETRPSEKLGKEKAADALPAPGLSDTADVVLRELVFHPGDRSRRLAVAVH